MTHRTINLIAWVLLGCLTTDPTGARQMRQLEPIPTPELTLSELPEGARLVEAVQPVPRDAVADAAEELTGAWNTPDLAEKISDDKFDRSRFDRAMVTEVPRDAQLEIESVRSVQTLSQAVVQGADGSFTRVSTVAATASTRLVANDPAAGFVNAPGLNEIRFRVTERLEIRP